MSADTTSGAVALVIQTRIADEGVGAYIAWQTKVGKVLASRRGFLDQQVMAPGPPAQVDWIVIQRFETLDDAQEWMRSRELAELMAEVRPLFAGEDAVYLRSDVRGTRLPVSAAIACRVEPEDEAAFLEWETRAFQVEALAPGFLGHRLERPAPGIQDNWVITLTFESDRDLQNWLNSPERAQLIEEGQRFQNDLSIRTSNFGFDFWARPTDVPKPSKLWIMKTNLLVLLVLYPIVFLWGFFFSDPIFAKHGTPTWLWLFIANLFSTQIMGWYVVPWAFKRYSFWLGDNPGMNSEIIGWISVLVFYAISMAVYAYILTLKPLDYF